MTKTILQEFACSTADELIEMLSPNGENFRDQKPNAPWLFRGQGQDWKLIPSLFRKNGKITSLTRRNVEDYSELLLAERDIIVNFFEIADKRGLILPDDSQELRSYFEMLKDSNDMVSEARYRVESQGLSIMTLAQHYGLPTRLLDWTLRPFISAFFAAEDAYKYAELDKHSSLVVWAFYFPTFNKQTRYSSESYKIRGVTAPSATNVNLRAQHGVFTLSSPFYTEEATGKYLPLNELIESQLSKYPDSSGWFSECKLLKFTLPISESSKLLYLLAKLDITPSVVYPSYQSIVSDIEMQMMWE
jgi:hypothetical protein